MKLYFFTVFLLIFTQLNSQNIDSLKNVAKQEDNEGKSDIYFEIGNNLFHSQSLDSSLIFLTLSLKYTDETKKQSEIYQTIGMVYFYKNDFSAALNNFKNALNLAISIENDSLTARRYSDVGVVYDYLGAYDKAVENYIAALSIFDKNNDKLSKAKIYNNLGIISQNRGKISQAIDYYNKSLEIKIKYKAPETEIANTYVNIGTAFEHTKQYDDALINYFKAEKIFKKDYSKKHLSLCFNNIAGIYLYKNILDSSEYYLKQSTKINIEINNELGLSSDYTIKGEIFNKENQPDSAIFYLNKALDLTKKLNTLVKKQQILSSIISVFQNSNDFEQAFEYQSQLMTLKDSLSSKQMNNKIETLQIIYETDKKEEEINNLQKEISKNRLLLIAIVLILSLFLIIGILIFRNKLKYKEYKADIFNERLLRIQMNPHFIFNSLTSIQSYMLEKDAKKAAFYLSAFSKLTRSILNNSRQELITITEEIETIENFLKIQKLRFNDVFESELTIDEDLDTDFFLIPPMLSQPFIENAIVHGFKNIDYKGLITINFSKDAENLIISITDNGLGIKNEKVKKHKSHATEITKERINILNKKRKNNISFKITNLNEMSDNTGTKIIFSIPLVTE